MVKSARTSKMTKIISQTLISLLFTALTTLTSCCPEPDAEKVKDDFIKYRPDFKFILATNIENSPPCYYWDIIYSKKIGARDTTEIESWQYCCSDIFDSKQSIRIQKAGTTDFEPLK